MSHKMTAQEFAKLPESNLFIELIDGEVIFSRTTEVHQSAVLSIIIHLKQSISTGKLNLSPLDVYLDDFNVVLPDVFWVADQNSLCQLGEDQRWHGAPDLTVEILSPVTAKRDKGRKFKLYEQYGVHEYWITDPVAKFVEVFVLTDGKFARYGVFGLGETFISPVLAGKVVVVDKLFDYV